MMNRRPPTVALLLGLAGLIPFVACAIGGLSSTDVTRANAWVFALAYYSAVILAFVGAVHWGFVLGAEAPEAFAAKAARERYRLVLGVVPALVAWGALLVLLLGLLDISLAILLAGFVAFTGAESDLRRRALVPGGYMWMRWGLTVVVVLILGTVLTLRLFGGRVIF